MIPTFTLGKPAALIEMSMGRNISFDPQFRISMEGKPWSFVFWLRYKVPLKSKFQFTGGIHPAFSFKPVKVTSGETTEEVMTVRRYLAGEIVPNYFISKNTSIGIYYLYSHGIDKHAVNNTHFLTINAGFNHIGTGTNFYLKFYPQLYYLNTANTYGYYFTYTLTLAHNKLPFSVSSLINKAIETHIKGSDDFVWNISLTYTFNKNYIPRRA